MGSHFWLSIQNVIFFPKRKIFLVWLRRQRQLGTGFSILPQRRVTGMEPWILNAATQKRWVWTRCVCVGGPSYCRHIRRRPSRPSSSVLPESVPHAEATRCTAILAVDTGLTMPPLLLPLPLLKAMAVPAAMMSLPTGSPGGSLTGKKKRSVPLQQFLKRLRVTHVFNCHGLAVGGWWRLAVGGWRQVAVGGWWRLTVGGGCRVVFGGSWWLVVGG